MASKTSKALVPTEVPEGQNDLPYVRETMKGAGSLKRFHDRNAPLFCKLAEVDGIPLLINGFSFGQGEFGEYVVFSASWQDDNGNEVRANVITGSEQLVSTFHELREAIRTKDAELPMVAKFVKIPISNGRTFWTIEDAEDGAEDGEVIDVEAVNTRDVFAEE